MNFRTINTVIAREYLTKVKKKSFLLTTFLVPVIMAAAIVVMVLVMTKVGDRAQSVAVIDQSGIAMPYLVSDGANTYVDFSGEDPESFKNRLEEFDMDVLVVVSPMDTASKDVSVQAYSGSLGRGFHGALRRQGGRRPSRTTASAPTASKALPRS